MIKLKSRALATALVGMLSIGSIGCSSENVAITESNNVALNQDEEDKTVSNDIIEETVSNNEIPLSSESISDNQTFLEHVELYTIYSYNMVTSTTNLNIRASVQDGEIIGVLNEGSSLPIVEKLMNGWYAVEFNDDVAYVDGNYVIEEKGFDVDGDTLGFFYTNKNTNLITIEDEEDIITSIKETSYIDVYAEIDDYYLCKYDNQVGYIKKEDVSRIECNIAIVDISEQKVTIYNSNGEMLLTSPVVTGKPESSPSDLGLFQIYDISYDRYLVGPGYQSYINIMMKYNGGEGLHDAEHFTEEDGFKHGWRDFEEFGNNTYITNGSHGCVNMPHDAAIEAGNILTLNDFVYVRE